MKVRDVMKRDVVAVKPETAVRDVLRTMVDHHTTCMPVVDAEGRLQGLIPERNLIVRTLAATGRTRPGSALDHNEFVRQQRAIYGQTAKDILDRDVVTIEDSADIMEAVVLMEDSRVSRLPVLRAGRVVGSLSRTDILRTLLDHEEDLYAKRSVEGLTDAEVERRVLEAMRGQVDAQPTRFRVNVNNGTVFMHGEATSLRDIEVLEKVIRAVPGVRDVVNLLLVEHLLD